MDLFQRREPEVIVAILLSFIIATTIHEFMHAWTAWRLGDDTAARLGRITLNPVAHFEIVGFIGMVLISVGFFGIGWGKPVPVNPGNFRRRGIQNMRLGMGIVAIAGPISNVVQAAVVGIPYRIATGNGRSFGQLDVFFEWFIIINLLLAAFNMIPIPPLDGSKVLTAILPNFWYPILAPLERYGFMILFVFIFITPRGSGSVIGEIYGPVFDFLGGVILGPRFGF
ncbi:MAG: Peptidase M50 [uncultured Thermomicrobiales bacterium]|uniref:Peptidase M50 n=1 Tax=uncultured Thermomicrobiales bacterium TaxID=1645740 RepID=A0A6J4UP43_9BACT|nr:MAG: Peptidase M50 [uncultured Thermomicrobiales bacterium]